MSLSAPRPLRAPTSQHTIGSFFPHTFFQPGDNDLTIVAHCAAPMRRGAMRGDAEDETPFFEE
jgi:hypothetical protein